MTKFSASQQSQLAQIGAFLRQHRENQGKSLEDIAIRTYIRPQLLSGIETGDPDMLPEPIFVQGFIRRYAETLGLQGIEVSQQFTVTSIPSTPRPARRPEETESSTTRLTRRLTTTSSPAASPATSNAAAGAASAPLFNAGSLSPLGEPFPNSAAENSSNGVSAPQSDAVAQPAEIPLLIDDAVAELPVADASTAVPIANGSGVNGSGVEGGGVEGGAIAPPSLSADTAELNPPEISTPEISTPEISTPETSTSEPPALEPPALDIPTLETPTVGSPPIDLPAADVSTDFSSQVAAFDQANLGTPPSQVPSVDRDFDDQLPAAFTTEVTTTEPATVARTVASNELIGVEIDNEGPNLKPFAIGAVVIAALTAGIVLLANVLGGDNRPSVADSPTPDVEQLDDPVVIESELPPVPTPAPVPTVSSEPVYVEATATSEAWVSIIADGNNIFEGTLQPGDTQVWEAQENLSIYSGDAGALQLAANGEEPQVMGENGQPQEEIFTVP